MELIEINNKNRSANSEYLEIKKNTTLPNNLWIRGKNIPSKLKDVEN